jgi:hypothetical protein
MGELEKKSRQRTQKQNLQTAVLTTIAATGLLATALLAPNVIGAMAKLNLMPHRQSKAKILQARDRLIEKGYARYRGKNLELTDKGRAALLRIEISKDTIKKPAHWDKKWRLLIFDIPEHRRPIRDKIRRTLRIVGFMRLQDSVWIYPYDCEDMVTLLKADLRIGKDVLYLIVDALEYDKPCRNYFGLH